MRRSSKGNRRKGIIEEEKGRRWDRKRKRGGRLEEGRVRRRGYGIGRGGCKEK
jgi:hypothetical protein